MDSDVSPAYRYEGLCKFYANYGRYNASDFQKPIKAEEIFTVEIKGEKEKEGYVNYGIAVQSEDRRDEWGNDKSSVPTLDITELTYNAKKALRLSGFPVAKKHSSINPKESNPFIGGLWAAYFEALPKDLTKATHIQIEVFPRTKTTLIIELYDYDRKEPAKPMHPENWCAPKVLKDLKTIDKQKYNYCLPISDDLFKTVLDLKPTGKWQTLTIPLEKFVDWNKKQKACKAEIKGINEDIGNGKLDPQKAEAFVIQYTLVSPDWQANRNEVYVGREIKFIKRGGKKQ